MMQLNTSNVHVYATMYKGHTYQVPIWTQSGPNAMKKGPKP